jgi:ribulose-5-phosphate 4-epimerase/fuculose-1-phosphate aldolase
MNHPHEGYIKFNCHWEKMPLENNELIKELIHYRQILYSKKLIGVFEDGIGFGNVSIRIPGTNNFIITGSATGNVPVITADHISLVTNFDISKNYIECSGNIKASSESMSHAAIYQSPFNINAVVHTHHKDIWQKYCGKLPTTDKDAAYGTPEMAAEIVKIIMKPGRKEFVIIMGGHEDGIITFGKNLDAACRELFNLVG